MVSHRIMHLNLFTLLLTSTLLNNANKKIYFLTNFHANIELMPNPDQYKKKKGSIRNKLVAKIIKCKHYETRFHIVLKKLFLRNISDFPEV